jgi:hypothetical protein
MTGSTRRSAIEGKAMRRRTASPTQIKTTLPRHRWISVLGPALAPTWRSVHLGHKHMKLKDVLAFSTPRLFGAHEWGDMAPPHLYLRRSKTALTGMPARPRRG